MNDGKRTCERVLGEVNLPPNVKPTKSDLRTVEKYIRQKYEKRMYCDKETDGPGTFVSRSSGRWRRCSSCSSPATTATTTTTTVRSGRTLRSVRRYADSTSNNRQQTPVIKALEEIGWILEGTSEY